jgi:hypothetical protein
MRNAGWEVQHVMAHYSVATGGLKSNELWFIENPMSLLALV